MAIAAAPLKGTQDSRPVDLAGQELLTGEGLGATPGILSQTSSAFTYVDLFAGCGGLSLGLRRAGGTHVMAVEKSPMAGESYFKNLIDRDEDEWQRHLSADVAVQAEAGLVVNTLGSVLGDSQTMKRIASAGLDLVAGGPPCQGFSLAGRRDSKDPRNILAWQFLEFVNTANPRFVIIENVVGMHRKFHKSSSQTPFESLRNALSMQGDKGYEVQGVLLNAMHYGAPQSRPRMMLIGVRKDVAQELGMSFSPDVLESQFLDGSDARPNTMLPPPQLTASQVRTTAHALFDLMSNAPDGVDTSYIDDLRESEVWRIEALPGSTPVNHELRTHRSSTKDLFRLIKVLQDNNLVQPARRARAAGYSPEAVVALLTKIETLSFPLSSGDEHLAFRTPDELLTEIKTLLTLKHSQTVLDWKAPSRTVVTIPDDYIHPLLPRTFSVRELARLQGFPDGFEFHGKVTTGGLSRRVDVPQYSQVGNAVSPLVGLALGTMISGYVARAEEPKVQHRLIPIAHSS